MRVSDAELQLCGRKVCSCMQCAVCVPLQLLSVCRMAWRLTDCRVGVVNLPDSISLSFAFTVTLKCSLSLSLQWARKFAIQFSVFVLMCFLLSASGGKLFCTRLSFSGDVISVSALTVARRRILFLMKMGKKCINRWSKKVKFLNKSKKWDRNG